MSRGKRPPAAPAAIIIPALKSTPPSAPNHRWAITLASRRAAIRRGSALALGAQFGEAEQCSGE